MILTALGRKYPPKLRPIHNRRPLGAYYRKKRDCSPLKPDRETHGSQSESSEEVSPPKSAATDHPPRPSDDQKVERERSPDRPRGSRCPLDRRLVSIRVKELLSANNLSTEVIATNVEVVERIERQLKAKRKKRRKHAADLLEQKQLELDYTFACRAKELKKNNEDISEINIWLHAREALRAFEADHPELVGSFVIDDE